MTEAERSADYDKALDTAMAEIDELRPLHQKVNERMRHLKAVCASLARLQGREIEVELYGFYIPTSQGRKKY